MCTKDWIYVDDVGDAFARLVEAPRLQYAVYNLGLGANVAVRQVMDAIRPCGPGSR